MNINEARVETQAVFLLHSEPRQNWKQAENDVTLKRKPPHILLMAGVTSVSNSWYESASMQQKFLYAMIFCHLVVRPQITEKCYVRSKLRST